ncbi:uncharacterized protein TA17470 [Theileria annulata]|uniref:Uncharacterized protein n=1 Tax=Theileria annulata TaxID=5874 RepID=Q4UAW0_THEAN|nr:uncharacterized protein TA17470 [Theileria annulata]CAI76041.1 hypothetical protein TA17470 [Theileria annulata]|eukprot:XP_955517.1 hypothetical protein TA17470 [Theileria annulata]
MDWSNYMFIKYFIHRMSYELFKCCINNYVFIISNMFKIIIILPSFVYSNLILYRFLKTQTTQQKHFLLFQPILLFYTIYTILAILN